MVSNNSKPASLLIFVLFLFLSARFIRRGSWEKPFVDFPCKRPVVVLRLLGYPRDLLEFSSCHGCASFAVAPYKLFSSIKLIVDKRSSYKPSNRYIMR